MKIFFYSLATLLLLTGCSQKELTIKTLQPSELHDYKISTIKLNEFIYDDINQKNYIMERIANKYVEGKNVFMISNDPFYADTIINGDVVESTMFVSRYFDTYVDYSRCMYYRYDEKNKKKECVEYHIKQIPCVTKDYNVRTNIDVTDKRSGQIIFSKLYSRHTRDDKCYRYDYGHRSFFDQGNKFEINSQLAESIAQEFINDISPHYVYIDIPIIEELDEKALKFSKETEVRFENAVNLLEKNEVLLAEQLFNDLNASFNSQSAEVIYNLGLIEEYKNNLVNANKLYENARSLTINVDYLTLIQNGIIRTKRNLENKIKAKSQLP